MEETLKEKHLYFSYPAMWLSPKDRTDLWADIKYALPENYILSWSYGDVVDDNANIHALSNSLKEIAGADIVIFSDNWSESNKCRIEMNVCLTYHKKIWIYNRRSKCFTNPQH